MIIASRNRDKVREVRAILSEYDIGTVDPRTLPDWFQPVESEPTLEGNATLKALSCAEQCGGISLADDTGLFVNALNGEPGVHSARFAGKDATYDDNNRKLLSLLEDIPIEERTAHFKTVVACAKLDEVLFVVSGSLEGIIADEPEGDGGFGYDPIFYLPDEGKTLAELTSEEKNEISHRRKAFEKAGRELLRLMEEGSL